MSKPRPNPRVTEIERPFTGPSGWIEGLGLAAITLVRCIGLYLNILAGRARLDLPAFAQALRQSGLSILPAITLVSLALGAILGHQTGAILKGFDAPQLVLLSITYAVVMELVPVLVGILVAGRAGVDLAVRQASLSVSGEVDGLLAMGIDPILYTLAPTLLAMLIMSFAFAIWGSLMTIIATFLWLSLVSQITPALFLDSFINAIQPADLLEAIGKPLLFALLIALLATIYGTAAGRNPQNIGAAATRTMIGAVAAILVADLVVILLTSS